MSINKAGKPVERRVVKLASIVDFLFVEERVVMFGCCLNGIMLWRIGLNDRPSS